MKYCLTAGDGNSATSRRGTRRTTSALLTADSLASGFAGLPSGVTRWTVMRALRLAAQGLGLSARELQLLEVYIEHTFDADWITGGEPIVITPVVELAEALGVTERQIRNIEHSLLCRGLITFRDCGNHLRRGRRDPRTGQLIHGYGPSLAPTATRFAEIDALGAQTARDRAATRQSRLAIGALRRRIRADVEALREAGRVQEAEAATIRLGHEPIRQAAATPLAELERRRGRLKELASQLQIILGGADATPSLAKTSARAEIPDQPAVQKINREFLKERSPSKACLEVIGRRTPGSPDQDHAGRRMTDKNKLGLGPDPRCASQVGPSAQRCAATKKHMPSQSHGMERVALHKLAEKLPARFAAYVDCRKPLAWSDLVDAAAEVCRELRMDAAAWGEACLALGRNAAAVAVLLVDARTPVSGGHGEGGISNPTAYLRAMIACGREGRLRLDASVCALAARGRRKPPTLAQASPGWTSSPVAVSAGTRAAGIYPNPEVYP